jgi:uncharacterized repeat protein (TIGR01451 family)
LFRKSIVILILSITALLASAGEAFALLYTGGSGDGFDVAIGANADVVTIGSPAQTFLVGDSATAISTITIKMEVGQPGGGINTTDDIRVKIPTSLDMIWDSTDTTATIGGSASAKVSTTVSYEDSNKTLVIDVTTNFANEDNITVSDLSFKDFNSVGYDNLELEIDNAGTTAATDNNRKTISLPASSATFTGGQGDGFAVDSNIRYWVASADGNWNDTANWSDTSAGTSGFSVPASGQVAVFDSGSTKQCAVNIATVSLGDLILESGYTGASAIVDANANDIAVSSNVIISGGELELDASSDLTVGGTLTVSGGTLDGLNGTIDANGAVSLSSGTLIAPSGNLAVAGNWTKTGGTFTSGTGTVTFDAASGTQTLTSGGITDNDDFYNITHSGAGTLQLQDALVVKATLTNSAGTWDANGKSITIYENFANTATFTHNNNTITFRGTAQSDITGNNTFYNLTIDTNTDGAKTVRFGAGSTQTIANTLSITGYAGKVLTIRSTVDGTQATIDIPASITSGVDYVDVKDSKIDDANYTITAGPNSTDSGNNTNWIFGSGTARTISGSLYQSNRTTKLTNQTVKLSVNGASAVQQTASGGDFTFSNILLSSGDTILVWIDDDATYEGNTVTISDGNNLTGLAVYAGHVTVRYETGSSITNANLSTAKGSLTDDDIKYSVTSGNLTVNDNFRFYIPTTYTFAPGGQITVDDIEIDGTLNANGNDVTVSGDWDNSAGSYISGNNTTTFDGSSKQILTSGGTGDTNDFYNLTHSGSAELELAAGEPIDVDGTLTQSGAGDFDTQGNNITSGGLTVSNGSFNNDSRAGTWDVNGAVSISAGTLVATSGNLSVSGAWNKTGGTFTHNSGTVTFDGSSAQTVTAGGSAFNTLVVTNSSDYVTFNDAVSCANFTAQTPSSKMKFKESVDFTVTGTLTLNGQAAGTEIELISALDGTDWNLNLNGNPGTASYVKVKNSNATNGAVTASNSIDLGSNTNWTFQAVTRYWLGTANANWNNTSNWSSTSGGAGGADVPSTGDTAIFDGNGNNPCTLNIATASLAVLDIQAGYTSKLDANTNDITLSGSVTIAGGELELDTNSGLTIGGTLTVSGGILDGLNGTIDANGTVTITGGELIAPSGNFNVAGNFAHSAGTFTHSSGTIVFDGAGATTVSGDTTFYNLTCTTAGKQLNFTAGTTQTVSNTLTLTGASGNLITLRSTQAGSKWDITLSGAAQTVSYIDVKDADANTNTVTCYNSTDSGNNNTNWVFNTVGITSPTDAKTVGRTPCVIGTAGPQDTVIIKDKDGTQVATTTADTNGNFRVLISTPLATGANSLTPYVGAIPGATINFMVVASPTTDEVPTITSPADGQRISGATPTCSGKGLAGQTVSIKANDANGNLLLQEVGSGTVDASGNYSITLTTPLPKGENYLTVTVDGVTSDICTVTLTDPFGVVFDSVSNNPIQGATVTIFTSAGVQATPGVEIDAGDSNPQVTGSDGAYSFLTIDGDFYITVSASGYSYPSTKSSFPAGRTIVTGSKGEVFTVAGAVIEMDLPLDANTLLLKIKKDANKKEVVVGDVVTYTVTIKNETSSDVTNVYLEDKIPAGFKYISGKAILDNAAIADPTGNRPLTFNIGTVSAGTTRTLKYQLVVGSGVTLGNYENIAWAKYSQGAVISNKASETVKVVLDPLFDLGQVLGKVFWDENENGIQDKGEKGIPGVEIATEDGTLITTDRHGKYHLSSIIPGRHLFRLDERSLPEGAYLTTDKVVIADITGGILAKVNFGVKLPAVEGSVFGRSQEKDADALKAPFTPFIITQDRGMPVPRLNVACFPLDNQYEFRIFTNYSLFIKKWKLEILDEDTKKVVKTFKGTSSTLNEPILWDGKDKYGYWLNPGHKFVYVLKVTGKDGRQDVTKERKFVVRNQRPIASNQRPEEIKKEKLKWIEQESKVNNLDKQTIRIKGETIRVIGSGYQSVKVLKDGKVQAEISSVESKGLIAKDLLEDKNARKAQEPQSKIEIILPGGEYEVEVSSEPVSHLSQLTARSRLSESASKQRLERIPPKSYSQHIQVGDDYLFFVAMGDAKAGYIVTRGNIEPVQHDDKFRQGFWSEGKLAYYLKGKIKGKYLITSSLDTERDKKELFRNLDPDKYYPVYGDASTINYDATNTQGLLYLLIEWDRSSILWGNYDTAFTDTEFAQFSRTLYGGKVHLESVSATRFGEPRTKLIVFRARAQQRAAHNEFVSTGGSLFYLKHRDIIEGSEKVKIEVRDKITGLVLVTNEMQEGFDYEIDYSNGRLTFWQPVSFIVESDSIISSNLLDGNPIYVVVDYEYETKDKYDEGIYGGRLEQSLTDYLRVGGTYVKEEQLDKNYTLSGADTVIHLGKSITVSAEFAESESEEVGSFISTDGGLSFTELPTGDLDKGTAYGLKGEAHLFDRLGLTSYYKKIEKGFSSTSTTSQQGKELMGAGATFDITSKTRLKVTHDIQKLIDDGNPQTRLQVGAQKTETSSVQITHQMEKLKLTGEYRHQEVTEEKEEFKSETNTEEETIALKADYKATDKVTLSLEQQATLKGTPNHQTSVGVNAELNKHLSVRAKETVGTQGTATSVGATVNVKDRLSLMSDYTRTNYKSGEIGNTASLSGKAKVDDKTEMHTTFAVTDTSKGGKTQSITFGGKRKLKDGLDLTVNRTYAKSRNNLTQANTFGLVREKAGKRLEATFTEQRAISDTEVSNTNIFGLSGDINDKWALQGSFERGKVQNHDGTRATRNAAVLGASFVDKDRRTGEVRLKASTKLELRLDDGQNDKRQFLVYNAVEGKINPDTTLFVKAHFSQTKNTTLDATEAQYKELVTGVAYRPVNFDRLNLLAKYTYLEDDFPSTQSDFKDIEKEKAHVLAGEAVYDLTDKWQVSEKLAYKIAEEKVTGFEFTKTSTWLWINRLSYNLYQDWQVIGEYRVLTQKQAEDQKHGALVEVARKLGDFIQVGAGYNFTDFNDDLTSLDYTVHGPFIRITGKFYDRTPEEIERARQRRLEEMIKLWAWELVNKELAKPESPICQELYRYYYFAKRFEEEGKLHKAKESYQMSLQIGKMMYTEAEEYIRGRIELEKKLKKDNLLALEYYRQGRLLEAKQLWQKIKQQAQSEPITMEVQRCVIR